MESIYSELALFGSKNECAKTDYVFSFISEVCAGTVSLLFLCSIFFVLFDILSTWGWIGLDMSGMAVIGYKLLNKVGNGWSCLNWLEMAGNVWNAGIGWKCLGMAGNV